MSIPTAEKVGAVIPAAGQGERLPGPVAKQFRLLAGVPLVQHTLARLAEDGRAGRIVLVLPAGESDFHIPSDIPVPVQKVSGGARRQDSVANGISALPDEVEWVVVHDGARPLLPPGLIAACLEGAQETGAAIAAIPVTDTVKRAGDEGQIEGTMSREGLWLAQTPQVARRDLLQRALDEAISRGFEGTDEASLLEAIGVRVRIVPGSRMNLKVTTLEDMALAQAYLAQEAAEGWF